MRTAKNLIIGTLHALGYEINYYDRDAPGLNPFGDMLRLMRKTPRTIIYDIGANIGQTTKRFREAMPYAEIHSFEPSPYTFKELVANTGVHDQIHLNNVGVGSTAGTLTFLESASPLLSSFLRPVKDWKIIRETPVEVVTVDEYSKEVNTPHLNVLKTDTQGFDFEVLKGASGLLRKNRVQMVFTEVTFSEMYKGMPTFDEIFKS